MQKDTKFRIMYSSNQFGYDINIYTEDRETGALHVSDCLTMNPHKNGEPVAPTVNMSREELELLMDDLWRNGIRPSNGEGNVGQIGAIKDNLKDLREDRSFLQQLLEHTVKEPGRSNND